jgi:hypothetical protein
MAEFIPAQEEVGGRANHLPNVAATLIDLHRLVSIFLASRSFADLIEAPAGHAMEVHNPLFKLQECEEDEISRILLTLAITARVVDDANARLLEIFALPCGTLVPDIRRPEASEPLGMREACNKIVHATRRRFDVERNANGRPYLVPTLYFYGAQGIREWKATLDVIAFAKEYASSVVLVAA